MKLLRYILFVIAVVSLQSGLAQRSDYQPEFTVGERVERPFREFRLLLL